MTSAVIGEMTNAYAGFMGAGKPTEKKEADNTFADLMNSVSEGVDVVSELTPVKKQDAYQKTDVKTGSNNQGADINKKSGETAGVQEKKDVERQDSSDKVQANRETKTDSKEAVTENEKVDQMPEDTTTQDMEVKAQEMMAEIMTMLGLTADELQNVMEQMNISEEDLLDPEVIKNLVVEVEAQGDVSALLTDEKLLDTVKQLQNILQEKIEVQPVVDDAFMAEDVQKEVAGQPGIETTSDVKSFSLEHNVVSKGDVVENNKQQDATQPQEAIGENVEVAAENTSVKNTKQDSAENKESGKDAEKNQAEPMQGQVQNDMSLEGKEVEKPEETPSAMLSENAKEIYEQVRDQIKVQSTDGLTQLQMKLNPENLGNVHLTLTAREGAVTAQFSAENDTVKQALEMQIAQLRENIEQQGVKVTAVEVTVASHAFEQNFEQGNSQNMAEEKEKEALRKATRKIQLFGDEEDLEDLDEAEVVTVDMMKADGNSMDYKA